MNGNPKRVPTVRYREVRGIHYLVRRNRCFEVGPVGWRIWQLCDGTTPASSMVTAVVSEFEGATPEQVQADCQAFLQSLRDEGLVTWE